jgi:multiple sugar transport system ATP-binding protein
MASIVFEGVGKRYADGFAAVKSLDLEIADGEFLVLVGPSGCGKSTALRMIAGLEDITEGRLLIDGVVANRLSPRDRDVAMVFQSYALYPHMTVAENIGFGLSARGARKADIALKVRETARLLELEEHLDRRPAQLSGGQRQRVAMGRAIARRPKAFLMDEPLSNLDARLRGHMRSEIAQLQEMTGVTTVYVTHDQIEAMTMGDRVAVMRNGELQQLGAPRALYDAPANIFVAGFIGSPTMNFLRVDLVARDGGAAAVAEGFLLPLPPELLARKPRLGDYIGRKAMLGVRPEALSLAAEDETDALVGRVAFVEDFGATQLAHLDIDFGASLREMAAEPDEIPVAAPRLRAMLDASTALRAGERLRLKIDARRVLVFDPDDEHAL